MFPESNKVAGVKMWLLLLSLTYLCALPTDAILSTEASVEAHLNDTLGLKFATECSTPNHEKGYCVELSHCPLFKKLNPSPEHPSYDFFVASNCTPKNAKVVKMCCGTKINFDSQLPKKQAVDMADIANPLPPICGKEKLLTFNSRIFGGTQASIGEFPWMGRLIHSDRGHQEYGCSAFLIHESFALTAAHCVNAKLLRMIGPVHSIVLGDHNSTSVIDCQGKKCAPPPQIIRVKRTKAYSGYDSGTGNHNNDITLIQLQKPALFTDFVGPICLLDKQSNVDSFTISGWGRTKTEEASEVKMKVDLDRFPIERCVALYRAKGVMLNAKNQMCAGGAKDKDSCTGDSGGPLMSAVNLTTWYAEGIVSFGFGCGQEGMPGVYTNIPQYVPWIKKQIIKWIATPKHPKRNKGKGAGSTLQAP